jgi:Leucine-rich repeat (LRR) protein
MEQLDNIKITMVGNTIDLSNRGITDAQMRGIFNNIIGQFPTVEVINLSGNNIDRLDLAFLNISDAIPPLGNLHELNLSNCNIREIMIVSFETLYNLRTLDLSGNNIENLPYIFENNQELQNLYLDGNPPEMLSSLSLRMRDFDMNEKLTNITPEWLYYNNPPQDYDYSESNSNNLSEDDVDSTSI